MAKVTYIGPYAEVLVATPAGDIRVAHGETVDLPDEVVHGVPAVGEPPTLANGFRSPGYRPAIGGLLDQARNWAAPTTKARKGRKTAQTTSTAPDLPEES